MAKGHLIHQVRFFYIYFPSPLYFTAFFFCYASILRWFANPHTTLANSKVLTSAHTHTWVNCRYKNPKQTQPPGFDSWTYAEYFKILTINNLHVFLPIGYASLLLVANNYPISIEYLFLNIFSNYIIGTLEMHSIQESGFMFITTIPQVM